jgi:hypothetical protein
LMDKSLEGGALELQSELLDRLGEDLLNLCRRFFEVGHRWSKRSTRETTCGCTLVTLEC